MAIVEFLAHRVSTNAAAASRSVRSAAPDQRRDQVVEMVMNADRLPGAATVVRLLEI